MREKNSICCCYFFIFYCLSQHNAAQNTVTKRRRRKIENIYPILFTRQFVVSNMGRLKNAMCEMQYTLYSIHLNYTLTCTARVRYAEPSKQENRRITDDDDECSKMRFNTFNMCLVDVYFPFLFLSVFSFVSSCTHTHSILYYVSRLLFFPLMSTSVALLYNKFYCNNRQQKTQHIWFFIRFVLLLLLLYCCAVAAALAELNCCL